MPKILDDPRGAILKAVRDHVVSEGWSALNIRAIARRAGIAQGTVYNYFDSREHIAYELIGADWRALGEIKRSFSDEPGQAEANLAILFDSLRSFMDTYRKLWSDATSARGRSPGGENVHIRFRESVCDLVRESLSGRAVTPGLERDFVLRFIASSFMEWSREPGFDYGRLAPILARLLQPTRTVTAGKKPRNERIHR